MIRLKTNKGDITVKLHHDKTPETAANFQKLAEEGYYNGVIFHRVIKGFMVQGGGFVPGMVEKGDVSSIDNEANNGEKNTRGTLAMARTSDPHSASAQFFINTVDNAFLDFKSPTPQGWGYCVFGEVVQGMETVDEIAKVSTTSRQGHQDVPNDDVIIEEAILEDD